VRDIYDLLFLDGLIAAGNLRAERVRLGRRLIRGFFAIVILFAVVIERGCGGAEILFVRKAEQCQKIGAVGLNSPVMGAPWSGLASLPGPRLSHPDSPVV
jgi:hypothetical protein